jgi:hypothetical protein
MINLEGTFPVAGDRGARLIIFCGVTRAVSCRAAPCPTAPPFNSLWAPVEIAKRDGTHRKSGTKKDRCAQDGDWL